MVVFPEQFSSRLAIYSETLSPSSPTSELVFRTRDYPLQNLLRPLSTQMALWLWNRHGVAWRPICRPDHACGPYAHWRREWIWSTGTRTWHRGFAPWIALATSISFSAWNAAKSLRGSPWFPIAFAIFWYGFLLVGPISYSGFVIYEDFVMNAYLWLFLGYYSACRPAQELRSSSKLSRHTRPDWKLPELRPVV